ncbi:DUF2585 family protein [Silicimonas sp. MF1-12-2]|uniref:DUF2585 family protein n=1 Tax=Silicimonas sp. MF1-12-2 TaxID=3384793 RepID=UPI0039B526BD
MSVEKALYGAAVLGALVIGVTLWAWGQPLICTCGYVKLWEGFIWSSGNSQHVADWYSLSHMVHGMLIVLLGRVSGGRIGYPVLLLLAIGTGMAWEIVEHTEWVLGQFREVTIYQGYIGDSVLNSVMDYVWMWAGFFLANAIATSWILGVILLMEAGSAILGRDCLTFTTLQTFFSLDVIDAYQQEINPNRRPAE